MYYEMESTIETINQKNIKEEFERTLSEITPHYQILNSDTKYTETDELLYGITLNKDKENQRKFIIFSSISIYNQKFRDYGADAVRILRWHNQHPVGKSIRVNRTINWSKNLKKKVLNFDNSFEDSIKRTITIK
jgi:hypothetical protein